MMMDIIYYSGIGNSYCIKYIFIRIKRVKSLLRNIYQNIKHIEDDLLELRPIRDRIFFISWYNNSFILLHHFMKKSQKTPRKEIEAVKRKINDLK